MVSAFTLEPKLLIKKSEAIITPGMPTERVFFLEKGSVKRALDCRNYSAGTFLELSWFFGNDTYQNTLIAAQDCELFVLSRQKILDLHGLNKDDILYEVIQLVAQEKMSQQKYLLRNVG